MVRDSDAPLSADEVRLLVDTVVDYGLFGLAPSGIIRSWNASAERINGYAADEIIGRHFRLFYTDEDRASRVPDATLKSARSTGRSTGKGWRVRKDGTRFWAYVVVDSITDHSGSHLGFVIIVRDETERHKVAEAREELAKLQTFEQISELTGSAAHDFNNILTAVLGSLELLGHDMADQKRKRIAEIGAAAIKRGQKLVSQMFCFSHEQALCPQTIDVNEEVFQITELVGRGLGSGIVLNLVPTRSPATIYVDPAHFQSAILNLIFNARDAMPSGGELLIRTGFVPDRSVSHGRQYGKQVCVMIEIADTGVGMAPEILANATNPFFTTKKHGTGTGLGLSQVKSFVARSKGELSILSNPGKGTAVKMFFPSRNAPLCTEPARYPSAVIVVDDDRLVLDIVSELLNARGDVVVHTAQDAAEALIILERDIAIELMLTDIVMPGMSGLELAVKTRELRPDVTIVLGSGHFSKRLREGCAMPAGMKLLQKPYERRSLDAAVDFALSRADDAIRH